MLQTTKQQEMNRGIQNLTTKFKRKTSKKESNNNQNQSKKCAYKYCRNLVRKIMQFEEIQKKNETRKFFGGIKIFIRQQVNMPTPCKQRERERDMTIHQHKQQIDEKIISLTSLKMQN